MFPTTHGCIKHNFFEVKIKIYLGNIYFCSETEERIATKVNTHSVQVLSSV